MNTPSHLIITAAVRKHWGSATIPRAAFLLGSIMPDMPLFALSIAGTWWYQQVAGLSRSAAFQHMFDWMFFHDPVWIALHNMLHAPLLLVAGMIGAAWKRPLTGARHAWFWFLAACLLHTALDIPTHVNDGPLVFFPLNWSYRFLSPVSYYDPAYYGIPFTIFEATLDLVLLAYLFGPAVRRGLRARFGTRSAG